MYTLYSDDQVLRPSLRGKLAASFCHTKRDIIACTGRSRWGGCFPPRLRDRIENGFQMGDLGTLVTYGYGVTHQTRACYRRFRREIAALIEHVKVLGNAQEPSVRAVYSPSGH